MPMQLPSLQPNRFLVAGFVLFGLLANVAFWKTVTEVNVRLPNDQKFSRWWWTMKKHVRLWKEHKRLCPQSRWRLYSFFFLVMAIVFMILISFSAVLSVAGVPMFYDQTVQVPDFAVAVKLSKTAESRLSSLNESITVVAYFDGDGEPQPGIDTSPMRAVVLGSQTEEVNDRNIAEFKGKKMFAKDWQRLYDKNFYVTINVFSARKAVANNILDCTDPIDRIENVKGKTLEVRCGLIGEPKELS
jgi:hypothetical protein